MSSLSGAGFTRVTVGFSLMVLLVLATVASAGSIRMRVDESGRTVYYNIPSRHTSANGTVQAIYYSNRSDVYSDLIDEVSARYDVDPDLVKAVIQVESNFNPQAVSPKGARGLMQLMPDTASRYKVSKMHDPRQNVEGGVRYLRDLLDLFGDNLTLSLAAYNAGENLVARLNDVPNYRETQNYVRKVLALYNGEATYVPYYGPARKAIYYKYTDAKGVAHYSLEPVSGPNVQKISFSY